MLNCAIAIVLYNRPKYTNMLFDALHANHYFDLFPVYVSIDYSTPDNNRALMSIVSNSKLNIVNLTVNNPKKGCGHNHIAVIDRIKEDCFILLEDDTIPLAADTLNYFYSHLPQLQENNLFSISGYHHNGNIEKPYATYTHNWFSPWGFAMTKNKWNEVRRNVFDGGWQCSWDTAICNHVPDKHSICPELSRIQNVGAEQGTHVPSSDWHAIHHHVKVGAWSADLGKRELERWQC